MTTKAEFCRLHSIYSDILGTELERLPPVPQEVTQVLGQAEGPAASELVPETIQPWLDLLDLAVSPHRLRRYGQENGLDELTVGALLRFLVGKKIHTQSDREKVDWLATYLSRLQEQQTQEPTGWAKTDLQQLLRGIPFRPLNHASQALLAEIPPLLDDAREQGNFSDILDSRLLQRGRILKSQFDEDFFHPTVLAAIVNYNLMAGKKFQGLLEQSLQLVRGQQSSPKETAVFDPHELLWGDYRSTSEGLRSLSELMPQEKAADVATGLAGEGFLEKQMEGLGIDCKRGAAVLRKWTLELAKHLKTDKSIRSLRICGTSIPLEEGEIFAFRALGAEATPTLKGEFARHVCHAVAICVRIYEETYTYEKKKESSFDWRKHLNALLYLLYEGRGHKEALLRLATVCRTGGFTDMSRQLVSTANKLEENLSNTEMLVQREGRVDALGAGR